MSNPPAPVFNPDASHMQSPKLRQVRGFPLQAKGPDGKPIQMLGLADSQQISSKMVATSPATQHILPLMNGDRDLDEIVSSVGKGLTREFLEQLVAQLEDAGLINGPTFDAMATKMQNDFDASDVLPPGASAAFADQLVAQAKGEKPTDEELAEQAPVKLSEYLDKCIDAALKDAHDPAFDELPKAVVVPHVDYPRGWMNYGAIWGRMRVVERPERVVILGTNHFGVGTGVVACNKGFASPLGDCQVDLDLLEAIQAKLGPDLGEKLIANRYDHENEHSIELQVAWLQHCLGADDNGEFCKVLGVLVHDPSVNAGESYDGNGVGYEPFVEALRAAIAEAPGKTLIVASADLSHKGQAFGDQQVLVGDDDQVKAFREQVVKHDREMLDLLRDRKPDELISSMGWQQNPNRWCSIGNMTAAFKVCEPESVHLLNYAAAIDPQGMSMVSSCAMVMK